MIKRNGSTFRTLLIAVVMVALIYFIYLYNGVQSRLRNSEVMSEKLKRDRESLSSQLNDISLEKERVKEKYQKERLEMMSKMSDIQNKYKMLQSQHQDMETEYSRIRQSLDKFTEDSKQKDANRNQEFMQLKQEKEMEVVKLKDENANLFRENAQYKAETSQLKQQLQQQQLETFEGWNQVVHLKKAVEHLQLTVQRQQSESESLKQQLQLAKAINMKSLMNNQMDTGGGGLGGGNLQFGQQNLQQQQQQVQQQQQPIIQQQPVLQQQQQPVLQQQQPIIQQQPVLQQQPQQGLLNDVQNGNVMGRILHQPPNNQFGIGQQAQMAQGVNHGLPVKRDAPVEQHNFQIQPAEGDNNVAGNVKDNNGKDLALQKQEVEQRKQQNENEHNQVQPPMNNEQLEPVKLPKQEQEQLLQHKAQQRLLEEELERLLRGKKVLNKLRDGKSLARILHGLEDDRFPYERQQPRRNSLNKDDNKNEFDEEEAEREHIFGMLNRHRHGKRNEPFEAEHPIVPPAFQGEGNALNAPQINVEDKLAGRDSANENHQFFEEKIPQEMLMGQDDTKDVGDQLKKSHKGNKRQKISRNHAFDNAILRDEKELQVQHPNSLDGGNKKSEGLNNDDQYYDEEEDDTYQ